MTAKIIKHWGAYPSTNCDACLELDEKEERASHQIVVLTQRLNLCNKHMEQLKKETEAIEDGKSDSPVR